jgi:hypothetical protein
MILESFGDRDIIELYPVEVSLFFIQISYFSHSFGLQEVILLDSNGDLYDSDLEVFDRAEYRARKSSGSIEA